MLLTIMLFLPYKAAADVSKQINTLVVSNSADYRTTVNNLLDSYNGLDKKSICQKCYKSNCC